jgi:enoyl-CoA hydratase/carnithine racemase
MTLALHLRAIEGLEPELALVVESAAYSTTQSGNEFSAWRAAARHATDSSTAPRVRATREGNRLQVLLDRPERHNAIDARMRDELCEALAIAVADQSIEHVEISGAGPSFCSGGDLGEFGTRSNPAEAHVIRLTHSPGRAILRVAARTTVRIHGATVGGGIEMAAFAGQVIAHPDSKIGLPEIGLGLIPGAGGTVSIPRRIGRQRTAALALTGRILSAHEALEWGLVDEVC